MQLPPPIHGASTVNETIYKSRIISSKYQTKFINIATSKDIVEIGRISFNKLYVSLSLLKKTITSYIKFKPDIVYITLSPVGLAFLKDSIFLILIKILGGNIVIHLHGKGIREYTEKSKFWFIFYRLILKKVHIIHLSPILFNDVNNVRDKNYQLIAIPNGIDLPINFLTEKKKVLTFIYLSNLVPGKGLDTLIKASLLLPDDVRNNYQIKIFGSFSDSSYKEKIYKLLENKRSDNIKLCGPIYGIKKFDELSSSTAFILPTRYKNECFPLSILEAMGVGTPVIASNEGAIAEIVDNNKCGQVIDNLSPENLSKALIRYINDPELAALHGKTAKRKFENYYKVEIFEKNLIKYLNKLIEDNR